MGTIKEALYRSLEKENEVGVRNIVFDSFLVSMAGIIVYLANDIMRKDYPNMTAAGPDGEFSNFGGGKGKDEVSADELECFLMSMPDFFRKMQLNMMIRRFVDYLLEQEEPEHLYEQMWFDTEWLTEKFNEMIKKG